MKIFYSLSFIFITTTICSASMTEDQNKEINQPYNSKPYIPYEDNYILDKRSNKYCKNDLITYEIKKDFNKNYYNKIGFITKFLRFFKK